LPIFILIEIGSDILSIIPKESFFLILEGKGSNNLNNTSNFFFLLFNNTLTPTGTLSSPKFKPNSLKNTEL